MLSAPASTIPALTGLRGAAALWVFVYHLADTDLPGLGHGYLGVDVFFLLSGFILAHVYAERLRHAGVAAYGRFLQARLARIYPLHLFALLLVLLVVLTMPGFAARYPHPEQRFSADAFVASLLLIQNWAYWLPTCWNGPSWSLSAEWLAYLGFPFLVPWLWRIRTRGQALAGAVACLVVLAAVMALRGSTTLNMPGSPGTLRMACEFTAGCLLYRAFQLGARAAWPGVTLTAVALIAAACALWAPAAPLGFALLLLAAATPGTTATRLLSHPVMVLAGEISFSLYMLHWLVIQLVNYAGAQFGGVTALVAVPVGAALSLAAAYASYRRIELPARAWGRQVGAARRPATG